VGSFAAIVGLAGLTWQAESQRREADNQRKQAEKLQLGQIDTLSRYSEELFNQDKAFDVLLAGLQAGIPLKRVDEANVDNSTPVQVANALRQAVYGVRERNRLEGHDSQVNSVSFSPDGKTLASGSLDKTIKLWNLDLDNLLVRGCDWVRDYLKNNPNVSDRTLCDDISTQQ
jgi:hypothetical protein